MRPGIQEAVEDEALAELTSFLGTHNPYVLFSGGRDSLTALHLTLRGAKKRRKKVVAVYVNTTISTPSNLNYIIDICKQMRVQLDIIKPEESYFNFVKRWGFPTVTRRWCCYHLKIEPLKRYFVSKPYPKIIINGIRRDESGRRRTFPKLGYHKHFKCPVYHVIFEWSSNDVKSYIKSQRLCENPLYSLGFRRAAECWCPVFKSLEQFKALKIHYPELFSKLVELESSLSTKGSMMFRAGKRIYLRDL